VDGLEINPAEDGFIIYQPEFDRVHFLNATAVLILELCNGKNSEQQIVELIEEAYSLKEKPAEIVREALAKMKDDGLLT
jgi:Coenzyme PQQ synthesis protein D (PqqD)